MLKSIAVLLVVSFVVADGFVTAGWAGMMLKRQIPVKKWLVICNPLVIALLRQPSNIRE